LLSYGPMTQFYIVEFLPICFK